ncbi:uncharacterized protein RSE6_00961 [Rhynchosporium secalis]|uniref:Uncharacterized protein n=1 Tax=Rhynchosporium secalis TaxID=38038 RepID=A0A1E1LWN6_RHYSE|nr:uncharacterized protein RSE6_00961 [Rhynchosporium secalis]
MAVSGPITGVSADPDPFKWNQERWSTTSLEKSSPNPNDLCMNSAWGYINFQIANMNPNTNCTLNNQDCANRLSDIIVTPIMVASGKSTDDISGNFFFSLSSTQ